MPLLFLPVGELRPRLYWDALSVKHHNMFCEHTSYSFFISRNRHSKYFLTANSSASVVLLQFCNKRILQGASAADGNVISHIPTVPQVTLMHLPKQANILTGTKLRLDIYWLLRLVKKLRKNRNEYLLRITPIQTIISVNVHRLLKTKENVKNAS